VSESILGHFLQERESGVGEKGERKVWSFGVWVSLSWWWCGGAFYIRGTLLPM